MTAAEAIRRVEQKLIGARTTAANRYAYETYAMAMLPKGDHPQVQQGFEAGYDAAMNAVRGILIPIQSEVLRDGK